MKKEEKLKKLLEKKSDLEHRLYLEQCRQHERINNMGWGYGMRHAKLNFSTTKEDQLQARIEKIDKQIAYVESKTKRLFVVRVSGSYSRTFDIEAFSYEEALEFAKTEWKEDAPLCPADSNGEDWEDYTSRAH